jgi:hypothetical protein
MNAQRTTTAIVALLSLGGIAPSVASASSLLSGYGGPGQGSQAIIGSTLVNGRGGGSSGGGGSSASPATPAPARSVTAPRDATSAPSGNPAAPAATHVKVQRAAPGARGVEGAPAAAAPYTVAQREGARSSGSFSGFSAADLLYTLLALGILIATALLMRRLASRAPRAGTAAKEITRRTRSAR